MRILFATTNEFIPDHYSGQNRTLLELAARLAQLGHEPTVLAGCKHRPKQPPVVSDRRYGFRLLRARDPAKSLATVCVTLRPDVVVVADGDYEALLTECRSLGISIAVWLFQAEPHAFVTVDVDRDLLYLASSQFVVKRAANLFGIDAQLLPPYIERPTVRPGGYGNRILFVNPVRQKGVELAFALAARRPNVPFTFVESWGLGERWRGQCFERALACGNIEWVTRSTDMGAVFDRTRLLLVPRFSEEGFCRLVTEAQSRGIPALASDRGSLADTVGPGGTVLDIDSGVDLWLEHLDRYNDDDGYYRQMSEQACLHAARPEIDAPTVVESMLGLLSSRLSDFRVARFARRGK